MIQHVFIVSDGTGRTATQLLDSALVQFRSVEVKKHIRPQVRTEKQIREIILEAYQIGGMVIHTLVSKDSRHVILDYGRLYDLVTIDMMGPMLSQIAIQFENLPLEKPGIFSKLNKAYFQRIEAVEFTLRHDDGQRVHELNKADIVLLGVSRTFKTPLSVYMAHKGWFVGNIPIILGMALPDIVYSLPSDRVFCLNTYSKRLATLRESRDQHLGGFTGNYSSRLYVQKELDYARKIFRMHPKWNLINVSHKPIEEISSEILGVLREYKGIKRDN